MIDYNLINNSIEYYTSNGFSRIESPWMISESINDLTSKGRGNYKIEHNGLCLVASGEQSFLYLYNLGYLAHGCYQTITPCFRSESIDLTHREYFLKNELIDIENVTEDRLNEIISITMGFFESIGLSCYVVKTDDGYDIECDGIELGSYGIRKTELLDYIYATGIAEPRTSFVLKNHKQ